MEAKYRARLNTLNWALLGAFLLGVSYTLLGTESKFLTEATAFLWDTIYYWSPFVVAAAFISLYVEIKEGEVDSATSSLRFLGKPALYVLLFACVVLTAVTFS